MTMKKPLILTAILFSTVASSAWAKTMQVYKSPTCGCCQKWIDYLKKNGFEVESKDETQMDAVKKKLGVPVNLSSCHTAVIDGYIVEGHVPAEAIQRLLKERPKVRGLSVPGMPIGSPGMEQGDTVEHYDVVTFDSKGKTKVFLKK